MTALFRVCDVFDGLATLEDGSVDLVVSSPPFLALRSYLPADHPDKGKEIGSEPTPAEFIDTLLAVTAELRRVLAPHGSICIELGDTYAGSGGAGGDYGPGGWREGQETWSQHRPGAMPETKRTKNTPDGWPLAKSKALIPQLYEIALAYGINPLTGQESPAGRWRVRNVVTWCRPNPPVGALGDKWRPATSDVVVACLSDKRYWDDVATRRPHSPVSVERALYGRGDNAKDRTADALSVMSSGQGHGGNSAAGAPLLDYWEIPPSGYAGAHYAVYPPALVEPVVKAMAPPKVCRTCGEPSRRIVETDYDGGERGFNSDNGTGRGGHQGIPTARHIDTTVGWSDCGHDDWRPGLVLDPFAGSGTTLAVATGHGHDAVGIDLDERNYALALDRIGPLLLDGVVTA